MKSFSWLRWVAAIAFVCLAVAARAQYTTVSGAYVGGSLSLVPSATIYWQPMAGLTGGPAAARVGSTSGQILGVPYQGPVTTGAFSISVPDALATNPNICYAVTVVDPVGTTVLGAGLAHDGVHVVAGGAYGCLQPTGSTWNFDNYVPNTVATILPSGGTVAGPVTFNSAVTFTGGVSGVNGLPSGVAGDGANGLAVTGTVAAGSSVSAGNTKFGSGEHINVLAMGAFGNDTADDTAAITAAAALACTLNEPLLFPGGYVFKVTATLSPCAHAVWQGSAEREFVTADVPSSYIDFQGTNAHAINVGQQGFEMRDLAIKYPTATGGPFTQPSAPTLTPGSGTIAAATYYVEVTCLNSFGESLTSTESSIVLSSPGAIQVSRPTCAGRSDATGWNIYYSSNSHSETLYNTTPVPWSSTTFTITTSPMNNGYRPLVESASNCAIYDAAAGKYHNVTVFTSAVYGSPAVANGLCLTGSSANVDRHSSFIGFANGVVLQTRANNIPIMYNFFQNNNYGISIGGGAQIAISGNDFEGNKTGDLWILNGLFHADHNYFEQQTVSATTNFNLMLGAPTGTTQQEVLAAQAGTPQSSSFDGNFINCNGVSATSSILIEQLLNSEISGNNLTNCGAETGSSGSAYIITNNLASPSGNSIVRNYSPSGGTLLSASTGLADYQSGTNPATATRNMPLVNAGSATAATTATNLSGGVVGSIPYQSGANASAMLASNTTTTACVLTEVGTGSAGQAPTCNNAPAISAANMTGLLGTKGQSQIIGLTSQNLSTTAATNYFTAQGTSTLSASSNSSYTVLPATATIKNFTCTLLTGAGAAPGASASYTFSLMNPVGPVTLASVVIGNSAGQYSNTDTTDTYSYTGPSGTTPGPFFNIKVVTTGTSAGSATQAACSALVVWQ